MTYALLQTIGGEDVPNIVVYMKIITDFTTRNQERKDVKQEKVNKTNLADTDNIGHKTQNKEKQNKITTRIKKMSKTDQTTK